MRTIRYGTVKIVLNESMLGPLALACASPLALLWELSLKYCTLQDVGRGIVQDEGMLGPLRPDRTQALTLLGEALSKSVHCRTRGFELRPSHGNFSQVWYIERRVASS